MGTMKTQANLGVTLGVLALALIDNAGTPAIASQSGDFVESVTDNGAGDMTFTLKTGCDPLSVVPHFQPRGAAVASQLKSFGYVWVDSTHLRVTTLQEGAAGAVSTLTDYPFALTLLAPIANT